MKAVIWIAALTIGGIAFAKDAKEDALNAMAKACKTDKKYGKEVKDMKPNEIAEWVEKMEHGSDKKSFTKTKCYDLHEKWEKVAERHEEGEEHEHKE